jgi:hypothetical protein
MLLPSNAGNIAAHAWLDARSIARSSTRWSVEIALDIADREAAWSFDERTATRFHVNIYSEEWGFLFCHRGALSSIRITDIAFAHGGRDGHRLLTSTPALKHLGEFIRLLERMHRIAFQREHASIRTDLGDAAMPSIRSWVVSL